MVWLFQLLMKIEKNKKYLMFLTKMINNFVMVKWYLRHMNVEDAFTNPIRTDDVVLERLLET